MPSASSAFLKRAHRSWQSLLRDDRFRYALAAASITALLFILFRPSARIEFVDRIDPLDTTLQPGEPPRLFIAIGSAPPNNHLRQAIRDTWLKWLPSDGSVAYRFFTDAPPSSPSKNSHPVSVWRTIRMENSNFQDLVLQPLPSGYGNNENNQYGRRALFQARWFVKNQDNGHFFLRVDDDAFLCLHRLIYEIKTLPLRQFFWGRFWCRQGRNRADENFMLFSADVIRLLADSQLTGRLIPFDEHVTLGWNFGYWSWMLNLTIFDDQTRIDAQQGYLTSYMHEKKALNKTQMTSFCDSHIYAHHVSANVIRAAFAATTPHLMYSLPERLQPSETCKRSEQSFIPARHSAALPSLNIQRSTRGVS